MNSEAGTPEEEKDLGGNAGARPKIPRSRGITIGRLSRWILGAVFIYLGLTKAWHPVEFLKVVRQYGVVENHLGLNLIAAILPWFEVFCGALLVCGIAVRGSALALLALLAGFSALVFGRAWGIHETQAIRFCAVRFDCGCGAGEVLICRKLLENAVLSVLCVVIVLRGGCSRPALRRDFWK
jgi:uncharacterized membrane protein YphA (DoxX/SURF4 family)